MRTGKQTWPLHPAPLTAYTTPGLNLLTPGLLQQNKIGETIQLTPVLAAPSTLQGATTTTTNFVNFLTPQYVTNQQQYFAYNSAGLPAPFGQYDYAAVPQYLPQFYGTLPVITPNLIRTDEKLPALIPGIPTTKRPVIKEREPTTRTPHATFHIKPEKLKDYADGDAADFKHDMLLLKAVKKINTHYVIEEIVNVPGRHVYSAKAALHESENKSKQNQTAKLNKNAKKISKSDRVVVEATGKTATKGDIPEIPFDSYFLPYFSQSQQQAEKQTGKKPAVLILEPHSKAIVGNGGTAISTPISKAYLKRGVTTNVYFNPESVAIAGVGGKAHAQADLELDLIK